MSKTIITIPFVYDVLGVFKGERNRKWHQVRDSIPVEIRDLAASDAPVGFRVRSDKGGDGIAFRVLDGRPLASIRAPGERYEQRTEPVDLAGFKAGIDAIEKGEGLLDWRDYPFPISRNSSGQIIAIDPGRSFRSVEVDRRNQAIEKVHAIAQRLCLVDGVVHVETSEPTWGVGREQRDYARTPRSCIRIGLHDTRTHGDLFWFRGDRFEDARSMAGHLRQEGDVLVAGYEVEDSGLIDWQFDAIGQSQRWIVHSIGSTLGDFSGVKDLPLEFFVAFCRLRDTLAQSSYDQGEALSSLQALALAFQNMDEAQFASVRWHLNRQIAPMIWRLRELEGHLADFELDAALDVKL